MKRAIIATLALAAAFLSTIAYGQQAANIDLNGTGRTGVFSISIDTLSNASDQTITVGGVTYYALRDREIAVSVRPGVSGRSGRQIFGRIDLENIVFLRASGSPVSGNITVSADAHTFTLEAGGANGSSHAVLSMPANLVFSAQDQLNVSETFFVHAAIRPDEPGTITHTVYLNLADAIHRRNPLHTEKRAVVFPVRSLRDEVTPDVVTATVASNFTQLTAAHRYPVILPAARLDANLIGVLTIDVGDDRAGYTHFSPTTYRTPPPFVVQYTNRVSALADVVQAGDPAAGTGSLITFRGDFSIGSFFAHGASEGISCAIEPLTTRDQDNTVLEEVTIAAEKGVIAFCIGVPVTNTVEIPEGEYTVEVDYEGLPNRAFPPIDLAETPIGRIRRDGTRVQIPFLTTYSGYSQRVVIVNRNTRPVSYAFSFNSEDGVTATPGEAAEGTLPAQDRIVLRVADIVTLEGGKTRTAATLDMVAGSGTIDVATTTVNMEDKGTDTVVLESVAN